MMQIIENTMIEHSIVARITKKDGTPVRGILKQEAEKEIQAHLSERIPWNAVVRVTPSDDLSPEPRLAARIRD